MTIWSRRRRSNLVISVLTRPVPRGPRRPDIIARRLVADWRRKTAGQTHSPVKYGGHVAVTRSLVEGLNRLQLPASYNPATLREVAPTVVVLSGIDALEQAIAWRRKRWIDCLMAGPNLVVLPHEANGILKSPEIDYRIVPSEWVGAAYEQDAPILNGSIRVWPAGVDENYWAPLGQGDGSRALIYWKTEPQEFFDAVVNVAERAGFTVDTVRYGAYVREEYKEKLSRAGIAIFISRSESQGIALAEAWAMNVPTLAWDPGELTYEGRRYDPVSSCPTLTEKTGQRWKDFGDLERALANLDWAATTAPRDWVLNNMTDERCALRLLEIASGR
jgi:hypothetical protein